MHAKVPELSLPEMFSRNSSSAPPGETSAPAIPLKQFRRSTQAPCILGAQPPSGGNQGSVTQWINKTVRKERKDQLEGIIKEIKQEYESLDAGTRPSLESILSDWGLSSTILAKANMEQQFRILAAVEVRKD